MWGSEALIAAGLVGASAAAALTGVVFRPGAWYAALSKPAWTPPNRAFPIAWTVVYATSAWAAIRVATGLGEGGAGAETAVVGLSLWTLQIVLNALWSPLFFGAHRGRLALLCIGALWLAVLGTALAFARADPVAAGLMAPYLVWGALAFALNLSVVRRNPREVFFRNA